MEIATVPPGGFSEYQTSRARNIERNNSKLLALGLISAFEEKESNAAAWGKATAQRDDVAFNKRAYAGDDDDGDNRDDDDDDGASPKVSKRARKEKKSSSPSRISLRLKGFHPDGATTSAEISVPQRSTEDLQEQRRRRRLECREARQRAAVEHAALGAERAAKENPTATYEHCLMRVRTMSANQLECRIRVIERAAGKHCVIKMAIMASCLQDEGEWKLAELATASLERLKALRPPPDI